jgi:hypothetical protein
MGGSRQGSREGLKGPQEGSQKGRSQQRKMRKNRKEEKKKSKDHYVELLWGPIRDLMGPKLSQCEVRSREEEESRLRKRVRSVLMRSDVFEGK